MNKIRTVVTTLIIAVSVSVLAANAKQENIISRNASNQTVRVQHYNDNIVRVTKFLGTVSPEKKSYSVIMQPVASGQHALKVEIDDKGIVSFYAPDGSPLFKEAGVATFTRRTEGADAGKYEVSQTFLFDKDEAIFGFGQIADGQMNKRGKSIKFWNTNTYTPIP